jgi:Arc/MetJ-type ribon-helix-helix transcriptional regulator
MGYADRMTIQIAVKLPDRLIGEIDELVADGAFASRSDAVRRGLEALLRHEERLRIDRGFVEGFTRHPDGEDELADATKLAIEAINDEPWDRWW